MKRSALSYWMLRADYKYILPAIALFPVKLGELLSRIRGFLQFIFDYEWRSMALGHNFVRSSTRKAMHLINPDISRATGCYYTMLRFSHNSREEWQACLFPKKNMSAIVEKSRVDCLQALLSNQKKGVGQVMISCHFDSFCMGMVIMGMKGLKMNVVNTAMIEDPRIHPDVRSFFQAKYKAMEMRMNGRMPYYQHEMEYFYQALERGEVVTLMGDVPGSKSTLYHDFLGKRYRVPLGGWKMAKKTGALLGGYICIRIKPGCYRVVCVPPYSISGSDPLEDLRPIYDFFEHWIRRYPWLWVSSDMLPGYE